VKETLVFQAFKESMSSTHFHVSFDGVEQREERCDIRVAENNQRKKGINDVEQISANRGNYGIHERKADEAFPVGAAPKPEVWQE
jgi:hypothetical protein